MVLNVSPRLVTAAVSASILIEVASELVVLIEGVGDGVV